MRHSGRKTRHTKRRGHGTRKARKTKGTRKMRGGDEKVYQALTQTLNTLGLSNAEKNTISDNIGRLINKIVAQINTQKKEADKKKTKAAGEYQEVSCNELTVTLTVGENDKDTIEKLMMVFGQQGQMNTTKNKIVKGFSSFARSAIGMKNRTLTKEKSNEILQSLMENGSYTASFCEIKPFRERLMRFASL